MVRIISVFVALCAFAPSLFAQNPVSPVTIPATRPGKVATHYNALKNSTTVMLGFSDVGGDSPCGLYISANGAYQGKAATPPSEVKLIIMRITPEEKIKSAPLRDLTFSADGELLNLGLMETASQQSNMDLRFEVLEASVPYDSFLRVINAKSVEAKLGSAKFKLTDNNLSAMRKFASRFKS